MTGSAFIEEGNNNRLVHCTESPIFVFPEMKLRYLVANSYMNVEIGRQNITILFWK
jgi:hypothetical protein